MDASSDTEVDVRLPLEVDRQSDPLQKDVRTSSGVADEGAVDLSQQEQHRFETPNGARSKWPRHDLPLPNFLGSETDRLRPGVVYPTYPGIAKRRQIARALSPNREGGTGFPGPVDCGHGGRLGWSQTHMMTTWQNNTS